MWQAELDRTAAETARLQAEVRAPNATAFLLCGGSSLPAVCQVHRLREQLAAQESTAKSLVAMLGSGEQAAHSSGEDTMAAVVARVETFQDERDRAERTSKALNNRLTKMLKEQQYNIRLIERLRAERSLHGSPGPPAEGGAEERAATEGLQCTVALLESECEQHREAHTQWAAEASVRAEERAATEGLQCTVALLESECEQHREARTQWAAEASMRAEERAATEGLQRTVALLESECVQLREARTQWAAEASTREERIVQLEEQLSATNATMLRSNATMLVQRQRWATAINPATPIPCNYNMAETGDCLLPPPRISSPPGTSSDADAVAHLHAEMESLQLAASKSERERAELQTALATAATAEQELRARAEVGAVRAEKAFGDLAAARRECTVAQSAIGAAEAAEQQAAHQLQQERLDVERALRKAEAAITAAVQKAATAEADNASHVEARGQLEEELTLARREVTDQAASGFWRGYEAARSTMQESDPTALTVETTGPQAEAGHTQEIGPEPEPEPNRERRMSRGGQLRNGSCCLR